MPLLENYVSTENMIPNFGGLVKAEKLPSGSMVNAFYKMMFSVQILEHTSKKCGLQSLVALSQLMSWCSRAKQTCDPKYLYY